MKSILPGGEGWGAGGGRGAVVRGETPSRYVLPNQAVQTQVNKARGFEILVAVFDEYIN